MFSVYPWLRKVNDIVTSSRRLLLGVLYASSFYGSNKEDMEAASLSQKDMDIVMKASVPEEQTRLESTCHWYYLSLVKKNAGTRPPW